MSRQNRSRTSRRGAGDSSTAERSEAAADGQQAERDRASDREGRPRIITVNGMTKSPAIGSPLLGVLDIEAVSVDGEPVGSATPDLAGRTKWRRSGFLDQLALPLVPRTLAGRRFDPLFVAAEEIDDPTVRSDVLYLGRMAFALAFPLEAPVEMYARLVVGKGDNVRVDPRRHVARAQRALRVLHGLTVQPFGDEVWLTLADVVPLDMDGSSYRIGRPEWTFDPDQPNAWRLTGGLFRFLRGVRERRARSAVDGIESAFAWSRPPPGRRTPELLLPNAGRSGPGPEVTISHRDLLAFAGIFADDGPLTNTARMQAERIVDLLDHRGYSVPGPGGAAPAGDVVEIVRRTRRRGTGHGGVTVRASARWVEAQSRAERREDFELVEVLDLLPDPKGGL